MGKRPPTFLSSNSFDWSLTIPSSDSCSPVTGLTWAWVPALGADPELDREHWARLLAAAASWSSASTGSGSSESAGGSGNGGVRVGDGEGHDHEVPAEREREDRNNYAGAVK